MDRKKFLQTAGMFGIGSLLLQYNPVKVSAQIDMFQIAVFTPTEKLIQWTFPLDQWEFGNRVAYNTAWWYFLDNGSDVYSGFRTIRFILQRYGADYIKIDDKNGFQDRQSLDIMPRELVFPSIDFSLEVDFPIQFVRRDPGNPKVFINIGEFNPKADDIQDSDIHWYYQGAGLLVGIYGEDIILRLWLQSMRDDVRFISPLE